MFFVCFVLVSIYMCFKRRKEMKNKRRTALIVLIAVVTLVIMSTVVAFAAGDVGDQIAGGINDAIKTVRKIINPIATIAVIGCGIYCIMGSDPQNIKKAKTWGIAIFVGLILINIAGPIVDWASSIGK